MTVGLPVALVYALALVIGYGYSAPPLRLMTRGLGEFAAALTVALLTPLAGYGVAAGGLGASVLWLSLPLLATSLAFMIVVALPDYEVDDPTGKRNWVVRLGRDGAGHVHNGLLVLSYALLALVTLAGHLPGQVAATLDLVVGRLYRFIAGDGCIGAPHVIRSALKGGLHLLGDARVELACAHQPIKR